MSDTLPQFLEHYREAWDALDLAKIADSFAVPCAITDQEGSRVYTSREALLAKAERLCKMIQKQGFSGCSYVIANKHQLGPGTIAVDLDWQLQTSPPIKFPTLYVCHKGKTGWRFISQAHVSAGDT